MDYGEVASLCAIHKVQGIGNKTLFKIKEHFGSFSTCLNSRYEDLQKTTLSPSICDDIINARTDCLRYMESLQNEYIKIITITDEDYPDLLRHISNPPYLLYAKGEINLLKQFCVALVGARAATPYGRTVAFKLGQELAEQDIVTVSGMARGIDTEVHKGTLEGKGKTIAVLGSGVNIIYPRDNTNLYKEICENGLVISEFAPGTPPEPGNFPARNRIISGISRGVVVIEAKIKSGALITADFALEQGRDVYAVPGHITSKNCEGTNNLIKQGAKLTSCIEDILEEYYELQDLKPTDIIQGELTLLDDVEQLLLESLDFEPHHFDKLLSLSQISIGDLSMALLNLELKGIVKSMPGNYYVKVTDFSD
ncbi:MAG TPA: DNA-processing protein DprA [Syntrophomonadaceae bacterium]|nr:DNA-processing protein DprA [Syntrophomonadaceae bacterium]